MPTRDEFLLSSLEPVSDPPSDLQCAICHWDPPVNLVRLPCHETHIYCQTCAVQWLQQRGVNTCPHCRTELFDLPQDELEETEDEEDGEVSDEDDGRDEDGARMVELNEDGSAGAIIFYEGDEDEDDNDSLAGHFHLGYGEGGDAEEETNDADWEDGNDQAGDEDAPDGDDEGENDDEVEQEEEGEDDTRDRAPHPARRWRQQSRRSIRYDEDDSDEEQVPMEAGPSRSQALASSSEAEQEGKSSAINSTEPTIGGSNSEGSDVVDQELEAEPARNRAAEEEEHDRTYVRAEGSTRGREENHEDHA